MIDPALIRQYFEGKATPEEIQEVQHWLATQQDDTALQAVLNDAWEQSAQAVAGEEETQKHWQALQAKLPLLSGGKVRHLPVLLNKYGWYAAAVLVAAITLPFFFFKQRTPVVQVATIIWDSTINQGTASRQVLLPDSSTAWLSPNSKLYWSIEPGENRLVKLDGEAFFDVHHDPGHPFSVQTGVVITKVLGTAFNIEAYGPEADLRISLVRGKVALQQATGDSTVTMETLQAGEIATWHKASHILRKDPLLITSMDQWTSGYLVLNDVLLPDALERIAARCHFTFHCSEAIRKSTKRVSTIFRQESPEQMLKIVGFITGCKYQENSKGEINIF